MTTPVTICLPVLNGARYLDAQLESLLRQSRPPDRVIISDDGSRDGSQQITASFRSRAQFPVRILSGPQQGYGANILFLLKQVDRGFLAFCDQDDIWLAQRLERSLNALATVSGPALHVSARIIGRPKDQMTKTIPPPTSFPKALRRNLAPANATMINPAALHFLRQAADRLNHPPAFPDWWIFAVLLGRGGSVLFDPKPGLFYRQHSHNLLGARTLPGFRRRVAALCDGRHRQWRQAHFKALATCADLLTPENRAILQTFMPSPVPSVGGGTQSI